MNIEKFSEFDYIKSFFSPLTPYGKIYKENLCLIKDKTLLERKYEAISIIGKIYKKRKIAYDKIRYHLKNIPYIETSKRCVDITDIFIYKKYLNNYNSIFNLLDEKTKKFFSFSHNFSSLCDLLNLDGSYESFYLSENYSLKLKNIREKISEINKKIDEKKKTFLNEIFIKTSIKFENDFVVINAQSVKKDFYKYFNIDVYDFQKVILKPKFSMDIIELFQKKEELLKEEKEEEQKVVEKICNEIEKFKNEIELSINSIKEIDIAISSFELSLKFSLKRPYLESKEIIIKNGVFLPLKDKLDKIKLKYKPLNFSFGKRINILYGSNMGGKTIVLKTLALFQYMAQCGFFVPAKVFKTMVFDNIFFISCEETEKGLSSFASEIYDFVRIYNMIESGNILIISDEFGKTTNVFEGVAILNSIIKDFSKRNNVYFFLATHFNGIKKFNNVEFLKMKGFNREKYSNYVVKDNNISIDDKIRLINRFMEYEIEKMKLEDKFKSDAVEIARIMGINENIYRDCISFMEGEYEKKE